MTDGYTVRGEDGFAPTYDEDETVEVRKGDLRAVLDVCTGSMDFGSGFLDNEQVEAIRKLAEILDVDPLRVTPSNFACQYGAPHQWAWSKEWRHAKITAPPRQVDRRHRIKGASTEPVETEVLVEPGHWYCWRCRHVDTDRPAPGEPTEDPGDDL